MGGGFEGPSHLKAGPDAPAPFAAHLPPPPLFAAQLPTVTVVDVVDVTQGLTHCPISWPCRLSDPQRRPASLPPDAASPFHALSHATPRLSLHVALSPCRPASLPEPPPCYLTWYLEESKRQGAQVELKRGRDECGAGRGSCPRWRRWRPRPSTGRPSRSSPLTVCP